ncbi:radical SAM protein [Methanolobus sp. WCC5]|uniref:radical SAM protein n=1 Tax=Methanolobus sp. WCC5 TaxID=3125785 RepID=UPI00324B3A8F
MALRDLTLEITRKCPMSCKLCSSNGGEPYDPEFTFEELKEIVDQAKELGVAEISLSGGEPFTCPFLSDLCRYISDLDIDVFIFTSGNYFNEYGTVSSITLNKFNELKECGAKKIVFSLHGSNSDIHDKMTRKLGSFNNLLQSIENAQKVNLEVEVHVVPVKDNLNDVSLIANLLEKIGVKSLHLLRFVPQGRGEQYKDELELTDSELSHFKETLFNIMKTSPIDITLGAHFSSLQLTNKHCTAGIAKAAIRPDGYVFPCVGMKNINHIGNINNIRDNSLSYILCNSDIFISSRKTLLNRKSFVCLAQNLLKPQNRKIESVVAVTASKSDTHKTEICHICKTEV